MKIDTDAAAAAGAAASAACIYFEGVVSTDVIRKACAGYPGSEPQAVSPRRPAKSGQNPGRNLGENLGFCDCRLFVI